MLLHGYLSTATDTWVRHGLASRVAARCYRVIMPDLRGHGSSAKPHDTRAYPADALVEDGFALIEQLGLADCDLGGYSLGGRIVAPMLARGATPARTIVAGTGLEPILHAAGRGSLYRQILANLGTFEPGSTEWEVEQFVKRVGGDPVALVNVLGTFVDTPREALGRIAVPTLVVAGVEDNARGLSRRSRLRCHMAAMRPCRVARNRCHCCSVCQARRAFIADSGNCIAGGDVLSFSSAINTCHRVFSAGPDRDRVPIVSQAGEHWLGWRPGRLGHTPSRPAQISRWRCRPTTPQERDDRPTGQIMSSGRD